MGTHVLDVGEAPTVNPAGASPGDNEQIQASPDAFGASIGKAEEGLGAATEQASTAGLDILSQKARLSNDLMANDAFMNYTKQATSAWGDYSLNNQGKNAQSALPGFQSQLDSMRTAALATMPSPEAKVQLDNTLRRVQTHYLESGQNFADTQHKTWQQQSWTSGAATAGDQAALFRNDPDKVEQWLKTSDDQLHNLYSDQGADGATIDRNLAENRGRNVTRLVEQAAISGTEGQPNVPLAKEYFEKYRGSMDQQSQIKLEEWLKSKTTQQTGDDAANDALNEAHGAHGSPTLTRQQPSVPDQMPNSPPVHGRGYANSALPVFAQAAQPGGMSPEGMAKVVQIESGGNPNARNGNHVGLVQAGPSYWSRFGQGSPTDPVASIQALGRSTASDASVLSSRLGRQPSDAELYLAHQQGAGGAIALLSHPNMSAAEALVAGGAFRSIDTARVAIRGNGGNPDAPAQNFTNLWARKFSGAPLGNISAPSGATTPYAPNAAAMSFNFAPDPGSLPSNAATPAPGAAPTSTDAAPLPQAAVPPPAPVDPPVQTGRSAASDTPATAPDPSPGNTPAVSVLAAAFDIINQKQDAGMLSPEEANVARSRIHQRITAGQVAEEEDARGRKLRSDTAQDGYVRHILKGDTDGLIDRIADDPNLTPETKLHLGELVQKQTSDGSRETARHYGPGFLSALKGITAGPEDPNRISDPTTLLSHVTGPTPDLTLAGYEKIGQMYKAGLRDPDQAAVNTTKTALLDYAKSKLSFDQTMLFPGVPPLKDPRGAALYNAQFVPKFEAAYDQWIKAGKSPWDFLKQDNVDGLLKGMRSTTEMAQARISAGAEASGLGGAPANSNEPTAIPPPPASIPNLDPQQWKSVVSAPPKMQSGAPFPRAQWAAALTMLGSNPTPETMRMFDQSKFGRAGVRAKDVLASMTRQQEQAADPTGGAALDVR